MADPIGELIAREGGYVDHPADRGGPTNHGITLDTLRWWRGDPSLGAEDVRELTEAEARAIYTKTYVEAPRFSKIVPDGLRWHVVDCGVMSGPRLAGRWLQQAINDALSAGIAEDGLVGPQTLGALNEGLLHAGTEREVNNHLMAIRLRFLAGLAQADANAVRAGRKAPEHSRALFISGWTDRALKFML